MYSYAANGRAEAPCRLSLTGCTGDIHTQLEKISGFNNWLLHKQERSYLSVFEDRKEDLVYLTADSENILERLDPSKIYIVGGLVDRNRWKGVTLEKAKSQGIQTAKLPIGEHMKMLSSQVFEILKIPSSHPNTASLGGKTVLKFQRFTADLGFVDLGVFYIMQQASYARYNCII
jgi:tRNA (guanine9-N1)-methyltransferase